MYFKSFFVFAYLLINLSANAQKDEKIKKCQMDANKKLLDCRNTGLKKPPIGILYQDVFTFIYLSQNPYVCDCALSKFMAKVKQAGHHRAHYIKDLAQLECSEPEKMTGMKFTKIIQDEIVLCKKAPHVAKPFFKVNSVRFVATTVLLILLIILMIAACVSCYRKEKYTSYSELVLSDLTQESESQSSDDEL